MLLRSGISIVLSVWLLSCLAGSKLYADDLDDDANRALEKFRNLGSQVPHLDTSKATEAAKGANKAAIQSEYKIGPKLQKLIVFDEQKKLALSNQIIEKPTVSLQSLNPIARTNPSGEVQVYVYVLQTNEDEFPALENSGFSIQVVNHQQKIMQGWIAPSQIGELSALSNVTKVTLPSYGRSRAGSVLTEGDAILRSNLLRVLNLDGAGVKVGIISDGANDWTDSRDSGDLPATGITEFGICTKRAEDTAVCDPGADCNEGTALAEIVHDIAPGAEIAVGAAGTSLEFIDRVSDLVNTFQADVIIDDLGFFNEPFFEDGPVASAVDAIANSVVFVSSAGNSAQNHYEFQFIDSNVPDPNINTHDFGVAALEPSNVFFPVFAQPEGLAFAFLQWDDAFGQSANDYDFFIDVFDANTFAYIDTLQSVNEQNGTQDPVESVGLCNPLAIDIFAMFYINRFSGLAKTLEFYMVTNSRSQVVDFARPGGSVFGHAAVSDVLAVGAIRADDPGNDDIEFFSANGPAKISHPTSETRPKPDISGIDGVSVTGTGGFPSTFFGTSAAAPHVGGIAALLLQAMPHATPAEIRIALKNGAVDLGAIGLDPLFGAGRTDSLNAEKLIDTDDDGVLNGIDTDDDNDNVTDVEEDAAGTFRLHVDSDFDGMDDFFEISNNLDPLDPADTILDPDNDGLSNLEESNLNLNPNDPDTDGDNITDGLDLNPGIADNFCNGDDPSVANQIISTDFTCAGSNSVTVEGTVEVLANGNVYLIAPLTNLQSGFGIDQGGTMTIKSIHPCPSCP